MNQPEAQALTQTAFNFAIRSDDAPMPIDELLAIVFHIAAANPTCKVHFGLEVVP